MSDCCSTENTKEKDQVTVCPNCKNQGKSVEGVPPDLAYYMGYRICESYYNNMVDKEQAIIDIIEVKNYRKFLEKSNYALKFSTE